jgi:geranylgeranyl pyrophosphate synthase
VYGQWLDLYQNLTSFEELCHLHHKKTGALFAFSLMAPAIIANKPNQAKQLIQIGLDLGLAFQIQDDLLDLQPMSRTGKSCGKDAEKGKKTAVTFLGETQSVVLSDNLYQQSIQSLQTIFEGDRSCEVVALVELLQKRRM